MLRNECMMLTSGNEDWWRNILLDVVGRVEDTLLGDALVDG